MSTPALGLGQILGVVDEDLYLRTLAGLSDLDVFGEPCHCLVVAASTSFLLAKFGQVPFTLVFDARPIGLGLHVLHTVTWEHSPTQLAASLGVSDDHFHCLDFRVLATAEPPSLGCCFIEVSWQEGAGRGPPLLAFAPSPYWIQAITEAMQQAAHSRDTDAVVHAFRAEPQPDRAGSESTSEVSDHAPTYLARFLVLTRHHASQTVSVRLQRPATTQAALDALSFALDNDFYSLFSQLVPAKQQLSPNWGTIIALPAWAQEEPLCILDLRELGGRVFAADMPQRVTYAGLIAKAGLEPDMRYDIYPFGAGQPLAEDEELPLDPYGVVSFHRQGTPSPHAPELAHMLVSLARWAEDDAIPADGAWNRATQVCLVHEQGMQAFTLLPGRAAHHHLDVANALRLPRHWTTIQLAHPPLRNVVLEGRLCKGVASVTDRVPNVPIPPRRPGPHIFTVLVDCRPLLMGFEQWVVTDGDCSHTEIIEHYNLWAPPGHQVQVEGAPLEGDRLLVVPGHVLTVQYVPVTPPSAMQEDDQSPRPGSSEVETEAQHEGSPDDTAACGPVQGYAGDVIVHGRGGSRSRSRCHEPQPHNGAGPRGDARSAGRLLLFGLIERGRAATVPSCFHFRAAAHVSDTPSWRLDRCVVAPLSCMPLGLPWIPLVARFLSGLQGMQVGKASLGAARACKFLTEPQGVTQAERSHLLALRSVSLSLGGPWLPRMPFIMDPPMLSDEEDSVTEDVIVEGGRHISCVVLKLDYAPERVDVHLRIPATQEELSRALQRLRLPFFQEAFPVLLPVLPQPVWGCAVFIASTAWRGFCGVCLDTSAFDGRMFVAFVPEYISRGVLIRCADLPLGIEPRVWVGVQDEFLPEGLEVHLYPGALIQFLPGVDDPVALPQRWTLGQELLHEDSWDTEALFPIPRVEEAACLLFRNHSHLHFPAPGDATRYRQRISDVTGACLTSMCLFSARPRPTDAEIGGVPCRTVIAVGEPQEAHSDNWQMIVLDCRPLEDGWQAAYVHGERLDVLSVLADFDNSAPLGWRTCFAGDMPADGLLHVDAGQVLVFCYTPAEDPVGWPSSETAAGSAAGPSRETAGNAASSTEPAPEPSNVPDSLEPSGDVEGAVSPASVSACAAAARTLVHFLILAPEYEAEVIQVPLELPITPAAALEAVARLRDPSCARRFPRLQQVPVQPSFSFACVLALPAWDFEGVPVMIACLVSPFRVFATIAPAVVRPAAVLRLAGIGTDTGALVFYHDVPWAVPDGAEIHVRAGCLLTVSSPGQTDPPPISFHNMLSSSNGWHDDPFLPGPYTDEIWILTDQAHERFPARSRRPPLRVAVAAHLQIPQTVFMFMPASPAVLDHAHQGIPTKQTYLAIRHEDSSLVPYTLDLRPCTPSPYLGLC